MTQYFIRDRSTSLPDGHQAFFGPIARTTTLQLTHKDAVRQKDQIQVASLATAFPELTITHAQMLLAVAMEALRADPTVSIHAQDTVGFPTGSIGNENLMRRFAVTPIPQYDDAHAMVNTVYANALTEIPLRFTTNDNHLSIFRLDPHRQLIGLHLSALKDDLAIELQIADISAVAFIDVVKVLRVGKPRIKGKITGYFVFYHPINQVAEQRIVTNERLTVVFALFAFDEATKIQRIMFGVVVAVRMNIADNQIIMGDLVSLLRVIPKPTNIIDPLAVVIDQNIVQSNDTILAIACGRILLQPVESAFVEFFSIPLHFGQPTVHTRLIGPLRKQLIDT